MNKKTIITILLALVTMAGQAQTIKASYEDILDSLPTVMQEYMAMQGVQHLCVTLRSVFNGKRAKNPEQLALATLVAFAFPTCSKISCCGCHLFLCLHIYTYL